MTPRKCWKSGKARMTLAEHATGSSRLHVIKAANLTATIYVYVHVYIHQATIHPSSFRIRRICPNLHRILDESLLYSIQCILVSDASTRGQEIRVLPCPCHHMEILLIMRKVQIPPRIQVFLRKYQGSWHRATVKTICHTSNTS